MFFNVRTEHLCIFSASKEFSLYSSNICLKPIFLVFVKAKHSILFQGYNFLCVWYIYTPSLHLARRGRARHKYVTYYVLHPKKPVLESSQFSRNKRIHFNKWSACTSFKSIHLIQETACGMWHKIFVSIRNDSGGFDISIFLNDWTAETCILWP